MKLATIRTGTSTTAVRLENDRLVDLGYADVGALLATPDALTNAATATGTTHDVASANFAPPVPHPSKILCVGLNYKSHIEEMGRDLPEYPTLFAKFADTLIGATDDITYPAESTELDWEAELTVVIGKTIRRASQAEAADAIAGFTVANDITCRDYQFRTREWLQGKIWDATTPVGPYVVTPDDLPGGTQPALDFSCTVDGQVMQKHNTTDLLFTPAQLVQYVSTIIRLNPGDLILTGTPGGVGHARTPQVYLHPGQTVVTEIQGLGRLENHVVDP